MLPLMHLAGSGSRPVLTITVSTNQTNFNLKTAIEAIYGVQSSAVTVVCTVNAGVLFDSTNNSIPSFRTGGFAAGSSLLLILHGGAEGYGGSKGAGGANLTNGSDGGDGGDAIELDDDLSIDLSTLGHVYGGGGGGGGGAGGSVFCPGGPGGGGDGGRGRGCQQTKTSGSSGTGAAGDGGNGGDWGSNGAKGKDNTCPSRYGGARGLAGRAVRKNGKTLTWLAGNNATQVKGAVS